MRLLALLMIMALPVVAQDRSGADRPSDWIVKHYETFGIWNSICDEREEDGGQRQRCYVRWVDVFSPAPAFAAQFVFVTPEDGGLNIDFGIEAGTLFDPDGFRIVAGGESVWATRHPGCLTGVSCTFNGEAAAELAAAMSNGDSFRFTFVDRHGASQELDWPLEGFAAALADFREQSMARDLF